MLLHCTLPLCRIYVVQQLIVTRTSVAAAKSLEAADKPKSLPAFSSITESLKADGGPKTVGVTRLDSKALLQPVLDRLRQGCCCGIPLTSSCQGLLVQLHDLPQLVVQAGVCEAPPRREGIT